MEGRPFTPPPPSAVQITLGSSGAGAGSGIGASPPRGPVHDDWGDWGSGGAGGGGGARPGAAPSGRSASAPTRAALEASAAGKDAFFARKIAENSSRPDDLPPNQGGRYVGFGSTPPPPRHPPGGAAGTAGVDDVTALLSKGLGALGSVAGMAANTATSAVQTGTAGINQLLADKQVAATLQQTRTVVSEKAAVGWTGLKSLYANVASTVESAAKESGYNITLGSKAVASSLQQQQLAEQARRQQQAYGQGGYGGVDGNGHINGHSAGHGGAQQQQQQPAAGTNGFAGFEDGADNGVCVCRPGVTCCACLDDGQVQKGGGVQCRGAGLLPLSAIPPGKNMLLCAPRRLA